MPWIRVIASAAVLIALNFAGEWLVHAAHASVPGSVVGMLLLAILIHTRVLPVATMQATGGFLMRHMALLLVPAGAAILLQADALRSDIVAISLSALLSLVVVMLVVGLVSERMTRQP